MSIYDMLVGRNRNKEGGAVKAPEKGGEKGETPALESENSVSDLVGKVRRGWLESNGESAASVMLSELDGSESCEDVPDVQEVLES